MLWYANFHDPTQAFTRIKHLQVWKSCILPNMQWMNCRNWWCRVWCLEIHLIDRASSFIIVDMAIKGNVNLVLLPQLLQALTSHGLCKCTFKCIVWTWWVPQHTVGKKNQPWLFLTVHWSKAILKKLVLLWTLPPILFWVCHTEMK